MSKERIYSEIAPPRFAIQLEPGKYARPRHGRVAWVPLEKAKLWRTRGHVSQHLALGLAYPESAALVEVFVSTGGTPIASIRALSDAVREAAARRSKSVAVREAERRVAAAREELEQALRRAGRGGA